MALIVGAAESAFPHICVVYRCDCGCGCRGSSARHGRRAMTPPRGWLIETGGPVGHLCPGCSGGHGERRAPD